MAKRAAAGVTWGAWGLLVAVMAGCGDDAGVGSGDGASSSSTAGTTSDPGMTSVVADGTTAGTAAGTTAGTTADTTPGTTADTTAGTTSSTTTVGDTTVGLTSSSGGTTEALTATDTGTGTTGGTTTNGGGPSCNDGSIDPGEQCDGLDLQGFDCASLGLGGGVLSCDPATCTFDTSLCLPLGNCGNGVIDAGEQCDGLDLQGFDCASLGLGGGVLACDPIMCTFDTSMCIPMGGTSG